MICDVCGSKIKILDEDFEYNDQNEVACEECVQFGTRSSDLKIKEKAELWWKNRSNKEID